MDIELVELGNESGIRKDSLDCLVISLFLNELAAWEVPSRGAQTSRQEISWGRSQADSHLKYTAVAASVVKQSSLQETTPAHFKS